MCSILVTLQLQEDAVFKLPISGNTLMPISLCAVVLLLFYVLYDLNSVVNVGGLQ